MAFDLTKLNAAFSALTDWVKAGLNKKANSTDLATTNQNLSDLTTTVGTKANASDLATTNQNVTNLTTTVNGKQNQVLVGTSVPDNSVGNDGDVAFVIT